MSSRVRTAKSKWCVHCSPNLFKDLKLYHCHGFNELKVSSLLRLNKFFVISCEKLSRIDTEAPKLLTFEFSHRNARRHCEFYLAGCELFKTCTLRLYRVNNMIGKLLENVNSKCPSLDALCIVRCRMTSIKISCQIHKVLAIKGCKNLEAAELDTPNLVYLNSLMNKSSSYSFNTTSLQEVGLSFYLSCSFFLCLDKLKEFVGKLNSYEGLNLVIHFEVCIFSSILNFIKYYKNIFVLDFVTFCFPL